MAETGTLKDLFVDELKDTYHAERQIVRALPKMIKASSSDQLRDALQQHLEETEGQIERLDEVFEMLDMRSRGAQCEGMAGILEEGKDALEKGLPDALRDAAIIASAQRVEHYEIAAYGTLVAFAKQLGLEDAAERLHQTLEEEKHADETLTQIAESGVNVAATTGEETATPAGSRSRRR
jgi:ferritin-like metal-binding protein YciE